MSYSAPTTSCGAARSSSAARRGSGGRLSFTPPYVDLPPPPYPHAVDCRRHGRRRGDRDSVPGVRGVVASDLHRVPAHDQVDHRAVDLRNAGRGDRGARRRHEAGRPTGAQVHRLFRSRHDPCPVHRTARGQRPEAGRGRVPGGGGGCRCGRGRQSRHGWQRARAHRAAELLRSGGQQRDAADRLLVRAVRHRIISGARALEGDDAGVLRGGGGRDVQVHRCRHEVRPVRRRGRARVHGRSGRAALRRRGGSPQNPAESRLGGPHALHRAGRVRPRGSAADCPIRAGPARPVHRGRERARAHCVLDGVVRGGFTEGDGANGGDRRAAPHRRLRNANRILVQPRRQHAVSVGRVDLRGAGRWCLADAGAAADHDADADADEQRGRRRATSGPRDSHRHAGVVSSAGRSGRRATRRRRADGHGAHHRQSDRELPGDGRDGPLGGRI